MPFASPYGFIALKLILRHLIQASANGLEVELEQRLFALYGCYIGSQNVTITETYPFPRIVRHGDIRANSKANSYYGSPIGKFLEGFASYFDSKKLEYVPPALGRDKMLKNWLVIFK